VSVNSSSNPRQQGHRRTLQSSTIDFYDDHRGQETSWLRGTRHEAGLFVFVLGSCRVVPGAQPMLILFVPTFLYGQDEPPFL
jgi:hypothetical protein